MDKVYTSEILKEKLVNIFKSYPLISLVYLFGSYATKNIGPMSDLDIAILWAEEEKSYLVKSCELGNKIADTLNDENIQVVPLNDQGLSFCFNVIYTGICIYGSEELRVKFETSILNQYLDFKYFAEMYNKSFEKRVLKT
ncbi:MAG: nucleotidyltransferase domain-containing protein [Elusimicrobiota bacterium]|nr:nucleotidyltransferase domain-containing protein [Elusimicrobiota bacterium]